MASITDFVEQPQQGQTPKQGRSIVDFVETTTPTQTQQPQTEQPGFFKSIGQSLGKMVAEPALAVRNIAKSAPTYAQAIAQHLTGDVKEAQKTGMQAEKILGESANLPFLGEVKPAFAEKAIAGDDAGVLKEMTGRGLELGSFISGGGAASTVVKGGLKGLAKSAIPAMVESGVSGSMGFGGQALKENKPMGEVGVEAAKGFAFGAPFGAIPVVAKGMAGLAGKTGKFATSKALGIEGSTLETALKRGEDLAEARKSGMTREAIAGKVQSRVDKIKNELSETGKQYNPIRELETNYVSIPQERNLFREAISKFGYDIDENTGKLLRSSESKPLSNADIASLEDFYSQYGKERVLSANGFLNTREKLAKMADYTSPTRGTLEKISADIREKYNEFGRRQLPGLEQVDAEWAPIKKFLTEDVKNFVDKDGNVKLAKVMSALKNPNNADKLAKLEKVSPGITNDFQILAAVEDIAAAGEKTKVGTYAQSILFGGGVGFAGAGVVGAPIAALLGIIVTNPKIIIPIIETYSKLKTKALGKLGSLSKVEGVANSAIQKIKSGVKPNPAEEKLVSEAIKDAAVNQKAYGVFAGVQPEMDENGNITGVKFDPNMAALGVGLGVAAEKLSPKLIKTIAKRVDNEDLNTMETFINHTNGKFPENVPLETEARRMAEAMGINPDQTNKELAKKFNTIIGEREKIDAGIKQTKPLKETLKKDYLSEEARKYKSAEEFISIPKIKTENIKKMTLFGSQAEGKATKKSDIDILVSVKDGPMRPRIVEKGKISYMIADESYADDVLKAVIKEGVMLKGNRGIYKTYTKSQLTDIWNKANKERKLPSKASPLDAGKKAKTLKEALSDPLIAEAKKYKTTINIQDKNDLEYLRRILGDSQIEDIKSGKMINHRGTPYEDLARVNIISETPKTIEQQLSGKIKDIKLKTNTFYHGTSSENAQGIMQSGFKTGSSLPESTFRGGGYGQKQNSVSLTETPKDAERFSSLSKGGKIVEVKLKDNARVISIKGIEDAIDLEDYINYLKKQKVDAVYIGGGEKELVILNPKAITPTKSEEYEIWNKANKSK